MGAKEFVDRYKGRRVVISAAGSHLKGRVGIIDIVYISPSPASEPAVWIKLDGADGWDNSRVPFYISSIELLDDGVDPKPLPE